MSKLASVSFWFTVFFQISIIKYGPITQLVEHLTFNQGVTDSSSVRDTIYIYPGGGIGRRVGLRIPWSMRPCRFKSGPGYHFFIIWGYSSAGRAPVLQAGGQRFDPFSSTIFVFKLL